MVMSWVPFFSRRSIPFQGIFRKNEPEGEHFRLLSRLYFFSPTNHSYPYGNRLPHTIPHLFLIPLYALYQLLKFHVESSRVSFILHPWAWFRFIENTSILLFLTPLFTTFSSFFFSLDAEMILEEAVVVLSMRNVSIFFSSTEGKGGRRGWKKATRTLAGRREGYLTTKLSCLMSVADVAWNLLKEHRAGWSGGWERNFTWILQEETEAKRVQPQCAFIVGKFRHFVEGENLPSPLLRDQTRLLLFQSYWGWFGVTVMLGRAPSAPRKSDLYEFLGEVRRIRERRFREVLMSLDGGTKIFEQIKCFPTTELRRRIWNYSLRGNCFASAFVV